MVIGITRLLLCSWIVIAAGVARGAVLFVAPDGTGDYPNLQKAHDAASPGDTLLLADGRFSGDGNRHLVTDRSIVLHSLSRDPSTCIIDCENEPRLFLPLFVRRPLRQHQYASFSQDVSHTLERTKHLRLGGHVQDRTR